MCAEQHLGAHWVQREIESKSWLSLELRRVDQRRGKSRQPPAEIGAYVLRETDVGERGCTRTESRAIGQDWEGGSVDLWREYESSWSVASGNDHSDSTHR